MKRTAIVLWIALAVVVEAAGIKTRAEADPTFDFSTVHTWAWDSAGAGDVMMARAATDDPAPVKQRVDPLIRQFVDAEMAGRGLAPAGSGAPDLQLHYYVIVTAGMNTQTAGQFLPAVANWGIPPFAPATTSFNMVTRGSLVIDATSPSAKRVVWRGVAEAEINDSDSNQKRDARIKDAAKELVKRLPLKKK